MCPPGGTASTAAHSFVQAAIPFSIKRVMPNPGDLTPSRTCRRRSSYAATKEHHSPEQQAWGSASFFFLSRQSTLDAAGMNGDAEVLLNRGGQLGDAQRGLFGSGLSHIPEHLGRQLVRFARPTLFGNQAQQSLVL